MILIIDNYDSFTYNLVHLVGSYHPELKVVRNDKITIDEIEELAPLAILLSPGPGRPEDAGIMPQLIQHFAPNLPIFGVCLGQQAIGQVYGGVVTYAPSLMHGKTSAIYHNNSGIFEGVPQGFEGTRYHSLVVDRATLPDCLEITAETQDGIIMGLKHRDFETEGVQFHPESILSLQNGAGKIIENWVGKV